MQEPADVIGAIQSNPEDGAIQEPGAVAAPDAIFKLETSSGRKYFTTSTGISVPVPYPGEGVFALLPHAARPALVIEGFEDGSAALRVFCAGPEDAPYFDGHHGVEFVGGAVHGYVPAEGQIVWRHWGE